MCEMCERQSWTAEALTRRKALALALGLAAAGAAPMRARAASDSPPPKPENVVSPDEALNRLMEGNARYVSGVTKRQNFLTEREALSGGQNPFAGVLSCADSRIGPEFAFDTGRGDLFVCRVAGNFVDPENLASFEYAVDVLKTPLIMVLGHESCGAVKATISSIEQHVTLPGHLPALVDALAPAVQAVANSPGDRIANATRENVRRGVETLKAATPILAMAAGEGRLKVVGGIYRLRTGQVELIG